MNQLDVEKQLQDELSSCTDGEILDQFRKVLVPPHKQYRSWDLQPSQDKCVVWIIAEIKDRDVGFVLSRDGFGQTGYPWGIVNLSEDSTGSSNCWYATLIDCLEDSGYFL